VIAENYLHSIYHHTSIDLTTISIPVSFKYAIPFKKNSLFFHLGGNLDFHLNADSRWKSETHFNNNILIAESHAFLMKDAQQGYWAGIEFLKSYNKFDGGLTLRYYRTTILNYGPDPIVYVHRLSLAAILYR